MYIAYIAANIVLWYVLCSHLDTYRDVRHQHGASERFAEHERIGRRVPGAHWQR